eukprot:12428724-Karenia_brevis.AAC.1
MSTEHLLSSCLRRKVPSSKIRCKAPCNPQAPDAEDGAEGDEGDEGEDGDDADDDDKDDTDNDDDRHQLMQMVPIRSDPQPHEYTVRRQYTK